MPYVILFFVVAGLIMLALKYWYIVVGVIAVIALAIWLPETIRDWDKKRPGRGARTDLR